MNKNRRDKTGLPYSRLPTNKYRRNEAVRKSLVTTKTALWPIIKTKTVAVLHIFPLLSVYGVFVHTFFSLPIFVLYVSLYVSYWKLVLQFSF